MRFLGKALSARAAVLLVAQTIVGIPAAAQQEVSPDHFDANPAVSQSHKPAPPSRRSANQTTVKGVKQRSAGRKANPGPGTAAVLKASAATNQPTAQPR